MVSDAQDYIGQGQDRIFYTGSGSVSGDASFLTVSVSGGNLGDYYRMQFAPAPGEQLQASSYEDAVRATSRESGIPGIDIFGDGRGCNRVSGRFEVKEMGLAPDGIVQSLWILYEHHCEGHLAALFGEVRYNVGTSGDLLVAPSSVRWPDSETGSADDRGPINVFNTGSEARTITQASLAGVATNDFSIREDDCTGKLLAQGWLRDMGALCAFRNGLSSGTANARRLDQFRAACLARRRRGDRPYAAHNGERFW